MHVSSAAPRSGEPGAAVTATDAPAGSDMDDWDTLLGAVQARLRQALGAWPESAPMPLGEDRSARARATSFDCADALDQLHGMLVAEANRCRLLEHEVIVARAQLREACTELLGTRADERQARHLALHDSLTLLPNRSCFCARLDRELSGSAVRRPALALLYLDLDGFKLINDLHGHEAGDELLRVVAAPLKVGVLTLQVRASIGIALCPEDGAATAALLKMADAAMYRAKRQQTGFAFFDEPGALRAVTASPAEQRSVG